MAIVRMGQSPWNLRKFHLNPSNFTRKLTMMFNLIWKIIRSPHLNPQCGTGWYKKPINFAQEMTNCIHFMHPPKIIQIWWGRQFIMIIFVSGKNRPLLLAKGVHWCLIFMCTLHLWPGTWDTSQRKFMIFHRLSQKWIYLDWLDFYVYVIYIQTYVDHFFILEIHFFLLEKITKLGTSPTRRHVMNCQLYQFVIVIDWSMKYDFFYLPSAVMLYIMGILIYPLHRWWAYNCVLPGLCQVASISMHIPFYFIKKMPHRFYLHNICW